jgi:cell wall-associated NlpC family hydrolase
VNDTMILKDHTTSTPDSAVPQVTVEQLQAADSAPVKNDQPTSLPPVTDAAKVNTGSVQPSQLLSFAKTLVGTPYVYGSANPKVGFDCSGFITYVFNHFNIAVARSSVDFTNVGKPVTEQEAKPGDIILFSGTNPAERFVGHMGLVLSKDANTLNFIHSSSGKAMGVTITPLNDYYRTRFVSIRRIFAVNDRN